MILVVKLVRWWFNLLRCLFWLNVCGFGCDVGNFLFVVWCFRLFMWIGCGWVWVLLWCFDLVVVVEIDLSDFVI